ncbi:hypothetical protein [Thalassomonas actiniarum]|uniref:Uncharacterized protein n=1 Tax=Thalassomonas actiniarum TaxID=485447 RepID=A0AAE9YK37_9GAMM|nr:hypothetical protein [Thalassomonas actiniarum]WDD97249.1 hypothetical protein SG35_018125 [Thalassomonas actiniarum]
MHYREKYALIRERWDKEDSLLLLRTGIFLTLNSVLLAAAQLNNSGDFKIFIIAFAIVFSSLWLITSLHAYRIIKRLYQKCHRLMPNEIKGIYKVKVWIRPNTVFCVLSPVLVLLAWGGYALFLHDESGIDTGQSRERVSFGNYALAMCMASVFDDERVKADLNLAGDKIKAGSNISADGYTALEQLVGEQLVKNFPASQGGQMQSLKCLELLHLSRLELLYQKYDPCLNQAARSNADGDLNQCH